MSRGPLDAVLFDLGDTLVRIDPVHRTAALGAAPMLAALGADPALAAPLAAAYARRFAEAEEAHRELRELDLRAVVAGALADIGMPASGEELERALRADHEAWLACRHGDPRSLEMLDAVRARGLATAVVSNTVDLPELLCEDLAGAGLLPRLDAAVFSSGVGRRKPHPAIFEAALERLGVRPERALFVGDSVVKDVEGAAALGMPTCLARWFVSDGDGTGRADLVATTPEQVAAGIDSLAG